MTRPAPQREEGRIQGQLNHSDSSQYIRELKDQIEELKAEVSAGPPRLARDERKARWSVLRG